LIDNWQCNEFKFENKFEDKFNHIMSQSTKEKETSESNSTHDLLEKLNDLENQLVSIKKKLSNTSVIMPQNNSMHYDNSEIFYNAPFTQMFSSDDFKELVPFDQVNSFFFSNSKIFVSDV